MTGEKVYVPQKQHEKNMQRALLQFAKPENHKIVKEALLQAGRGDLIGGGPNCLIPSSPSFRRKKPSGSKKRNPIKTSSNNKK
jgi:hypothetical protein